MWIYKAVFALAVVLFTVKAQELEETEGKKINIKMSYEVLEIGCCGNSYFPYYIPTYRMQPLSPTVGAIFQN